MVFYKVLSEPMSVHAPPNYKGLYRIEPSPRANKIEDNDERFMSLFYRYAQYYEANMGITKELTMKELKEFANLSTQELGTLYEVVFFSESLEDFCQSTNYGIDVIGAGGYSMIGDGMFVIPQKTFVSKRKKSWRFLLEEGNQRFKEKLNANGLFDSLEDAMDFRSTLYKLNALYPGSIEDEDWRVINISKVL